MRTVDVKLYSFSELNEEAQQKALSHFWSINVDFEWWESIYEDVKDIGCKISGFDIDRESYCQLSLQQCADDVAYNIMREHGEGCETFQLAKQFIEDRNKLVEKYSDGVNLEVVTEENEYDFDNELDELEEEFKKSLSEEYLSMLRREYEYQTSEEAIKEAIEANEYEFTIDGEI